MKWITRERPKIDRLACPWLIKPFIDKKAGIIYIPFDVVLQQAKELDAPPSKMTCPLPSPLASSSASLSKRPL